MRNQLIGEIVIKWFRPMSSMWGPPSTSLAARDKCIVRGALSLHCAVSFPSPLVSVVSLTLIPPAGLAATGTCHGVLLQLPNGALYCHKSLRWELEMLDAPLRTHPGQDSSRATVES